MGGPSKVTVIVPCALAAQTDNRRAPMAVAIQLESMSRLAPAQWFEKDLMSLVKHC
jgi:hypothetical protein